VSAAAAQPRRTFHTLDGLRGVAALAVAFRHIPDNAVADLTPASYLAVDLFFVLSGFVLAHAYATRLAAGMSVGDFAVVRLIRLYPLYLVASLITLALVLVPAWPGHYHPPPRSLRTVVLALLFLPTIDPGDPHIGLFPLIGPAWSLFFEFVVNIVFAVIVTRLDTRRLVVVLAAGAALLIATVAHFGAIDVGYSQSNVWGGFGRVGFAFFAGVAAHRLWAAGALPWLRLPAAAAAVAVLAMFHFAPHHLAAWDTALVLVAMPALVLASARAEPPPWLTRPFAVIGLASYAVYVLTNPVDQWFETLVPWAHVNSFAGAGTAGAVAMVAFILALALVLDRWVDVPVRARLTRWHRASVRRDYHSAAEPLR
jgi:peptidoglycan/LPS O-acetylase OafA/YrhL